MSNHEITCPFCGESIYRHARVCDDAEQAARCHRNDKPAMQSAERDRALVGRDDR